MQVPDSQLVGSYRMNIFIEPQELFNARHYQAIHDAFAFTAADPHIFNLLRAGPQRVTTIINKVGRLLPSTSKRQRVEIKRRTMIRISELVRSGKLCRVKRFFVASHGVDSRTRSMII